MVRRTHQPTAEELMAREALKALKAKDAWRFNRIVACMFTLIAMAAASWISHSMDPKLLAGPSQHSVLMLACMAGAIGAMMTHDRNHLSTASSWLIGSSCLCLLISMASYIAFKAGDVNQLEAFYLHQAVLFIALWLHAMFVVRRE